MRQNSVCSSRNKFTLTIPKMDAAELSRSMCEFKIGYYRMLGCLLAARGLLNGVDSH